MTGRGIKMSDRRNTIRNYTVVIKMHIIRLLIFLF